MAIRMQQRTGTYDQWNTANPILNSAEIGYESDTNKFKIGDGTNHWNDLPYFLDEVTLGTSLDGYIPDSLLGVANGVAQLNSLGKLVSDQIPNIDEISQDLVNTALIAGTGLDKTYDDNAGTITLDIDSTVATKTYVDSAVAAVDLSSKQDVVSGVSSTEIGYLDGVTSAIQTQINAKAPLESPTFTGTVSGVTKTHVGLGNVDNTSDADKPVSTATQSALDLKAPLNAPTFTGTVTSTNNLVVDGDFTVNGTNFAASATSITIEDNIVQIAHNNPANTVDLGLVVGYNDGTAKHAGLVKDTSDNTWKLFKGVTTEPATTVAFGEGSLDDLTLNALTASSLTVGDVSNTEFGYLNGVTSAIQTQLDGKEPSLPSQTGEGGKYLQVSQLGGLVWAPVTETSAATPTTLGTVVGKAGLVEGAPISLGIGALQNATGNNYNNALGFEAGFSLTTGQSNIVIGDYAMWSLETGQQNTVIGGNAAYSLSGSSNYNTLIGYNSAVGIDSGIGNTTLGTDALANANGTVSAVTAIGKSAGEKSTNRNTALGYYSLANATGAYNTGLGSGAGYGDFGTGSLTSGENNTLIGFNSLPSSPTVSNEVTIGNTDVNRFRVPGLGIDINNNFELMQIMGAY